MDGILGTLSVALGKSELPSRRCLFLCLYASNGMSHPCHLVDSVFRCDRAVNVSLLLLAVEKWRSCSSLELCSFSKMMQILSLFLPVVLFDGYLALSLFGEVVLHHLCNFLQFQHRFCWMVACQFLSRGALFLVIPVPKFR